ncbi:MAG: 16S rRNA (cytosine(967)-C(5))-methyltransferase RsmB [Neisseriaceae bacterium]|nr:16S rRNA (cytosine(967)-C(5))-methyltransferase RsmB [Neisseriaceae bacterium]
MSLRDIQKAAVHCLLSVENGTNLRLALSCGKDLPDSEHAAFLDTSYGVQRFSGSLKDLLSSLLNKPLTDKNINALLRVAFYQLAYTRTPPHAVVNEAVILSAKWQHGKFKNLVNALLRRFLREKDALLEKVKNNSNLPEWFENRLYEDYPDDAHHIIQVSTQHPPLTLRLNRRKTNRQNYGEMLQKNNIAHTFLSDIAVCLQNPVKVSEIPHFAYGFVSVQDFGAMRAAELLQPKDGERILDACAAPGGKTAHILEIADCDVTAVDIDANRLQKVQDNLQRLGFQAALKAANAANVDEWYNGQPFDAILADVPCSATGTIRRNPDIKWLRRVDDAQKIAQQQVRLLDNLWGCLNNGGRMLFATCSIFREENQQQVSHFLQRHDDAQCVLQQQLLPDDWQDGFYYALLQKN